MQYDHWYKNHPSSVQKRKDLRMRATKAERVLWSKIRKKQLGYKFRRQFAIGSYIVDFYCHERRLIIEIDGFTHESNEKQGYDQKRQRWLEKKKYHVVRYTDSQVLGEIEAVLQDIKNRCVDLTPPSLP